MEVYLFCRKPINGKLSFTEKIKQLLHLGCVLNSVHYYLAFRNHLLSEVFSTYLPHLVGSHVQRSQ